MGTKRQLSPKIREVVELCQPGAFLDAFAGMCSVGSEIGPARQVWSNDLQSFSNTVAQALFCSPIGPPPAATARSILFEPFQKNFLSLSNLYGDKLHAEARALRALDHAELMECFEESILATEFSSEGVGGPYDLFTQRYSFLYFSLAQTMEIDSLRCAVDSGVSSGALNPDEHRWLVIALGIAMNRCTTSTGHFAQPLAPKATNISRLANYRSKSVLAETMSSLSSLRPVGSKRWRSRNKVFGEDACTLLSDLRNSEIVPSVIYADPPYTEDQYSRYYHLYETLARYDHPGCVGRGRYRGDRAVSAFCLPSKVRGAMSELIENSSKLGADMVLSYPTNGLLSNSRDDLTAMFRTHYGKAPTVIELCHSHSTMGASKGSASTDVVECIYRMAA